jgi:hypothetical protein
MQQFIDRTSNIHYNAKHDKVFFAFLCHFFFALLIDAMYGIWNNITLLPLEKKVSAG